MNNEITKNINLRLTILSISKSRFNTNIHNKINTMNKNRPLITAGSPIPDITEESDVNKKIKIIFSNDFDLMRRNIVININIKKIR